MTVAGAGSAAGAGICLFGGSFNPPHRTHRRLAERAVVQLDVARVVVLPCRDHPLKADPDMPPAEHRLAMCELAFAGADRVEISRAELDRDGPSYSVDTAAAFRAAVGDAPLYWLIGSDNLPELPAWHDHHRLLELVTVVTYPRAGYALAADALPADLDFTADERDALLRNVLRGPLDDVNATAIRAALRGEPADLELDDVVDPAVLAYARRHDLYS